MTGRGAEERLMGEMTMAVPAECDAETPVVEAIRRGDRHAFAEFTRRQGRWVRGVVLGVLGDRDRVDDIAQQIWMSVWNRVGELRQVERWRPWLYRLSRNAALDAGRSQTRHKQAVKEFAELAAPRAAAVAPHAGPADKLIEAEQRALVLEAIRSLPALYREPFVLRHLEEWSYRQIAELLELPVETVETRLVRARRLLREMLQGKV